MSNWTIFKIFLFLCGPIGWAILFLMVVVDGGSGGGGDNWRNPPSGD